MPRRSGFAILALAALGLGADAQASQLFSFTSTPVIPVGGIDPQPTTTVMYTGNAGIADATGTGADIKLSFIHLSSPTGIGLVNSAFTFDFAITDLTTSAVANFTVSGTLTGTVTPNSSRLSFLFTSVPQTLTFSGPGETVAYTVTPKFLDVSTVELGGITKQGSITAHVSAELSALPEPSTLALAGLGGLGLVGVVRRRRRA